MQFSNFSPRSVASAMAFPEPDTEALTHSDRLVQVVRQAMADNGGFLSFDRFMELALYAPELGYYVAGSRKLGEEGDFITAPESSPLFGYCLARQCAQVLGRLGGGDVLEFGAGSGALALSMLEELDRLGSLPGRYRILELSPELKERQREKLAGLGSELSSRVEWIDAPPAGFRGAVVANEVVDAMPVHRFVIQGGELRELCVRWGDDGFEEFAGPVTSIGLAEAVSALPQRQAFSEGYCSEINLRAGPWLQALGEAMDAGVAFLIDYGYPRAEYYLPERGMGTLMCHYRHRAHADPYRLLGLQDITAYVDFSALAHAGRAANLELAGYTSQVNFLLGCGLEELMARSDPSDTKAHMAMVQGAKRLIMPSEMGERFQVLAMQRGVDVPLIGFFLRDLRDRL